MTGLGRILIAEDDSRDIELIRTSLTEVNLANQVVIARDGADALDYLFRAGTHEGSDHPNPVVVMLDIKMPKVGGIEVLRAIRGDESLRRIPVVMLTSSREPSDLEECYELGVNAYIVKPMKFGEFMTAIKNVGVFWALINEPAPAVRVAKEDHQELAYHDREDSRSSP